jgi:putative effector of murein hydrolase
MDKHGIGWRESQQLVERRGCFAVLLLPLVGILAALLTALEVTL